MPRTGRRVLDSRVLLVKANLQVCLRTLKGFQKHVTRAVRLLESQPPLTAAAAFLIHLLLNKQL